ncbi:hypothetical protein DFH08DRAFT_828279 [Mycena albidolilacea]|uniref:Uncharacterized protein n=1 Tax=Mycena albidolilacea TaxID=1033008 RepID=A0AAD6YXD5_9AGAR|nr:hypothetical protein DFH08DRAFT_828279 [Mycena albidolilacea]
MAIIGHPYLGWAGKIFRAATGGDGSTVTTANGKTFFYNNVWLADLLNESWTWVVDHINGLHLRGCRIPAVSIRIGRVTPLDSDAQRDAAGEIGEHSDHLLRNWEYSDRLLPSAWMRCRALIVGSAAVQMSALFIPPYTESGSV